MFTKLKDFKSIRKSMHLFNNDEGEELPGKQGKHLKSPASLPNQKSKGKQSPDVESDHRTEEALAREDDTWTEHHQKYQPSTQHPTRHHDVVTSSSEASVPLSSSTQVSPQSSARQSPLRRSFKSLKQTIRRSPIPHSESPSPLQESDFMPTLQPRKQLLNVKQSPGAPTSLSTDPQAAHLSTNPQGESAPSSPMQATREVTEGQEARQMPGMRQQGAGQKSVAGQGNKKPRIPPGAGFNPSKHRHTWPCEMIPINVPSPEVAQNILHPKKDVFVLKVAKVTANGDRRIKMELELVTPKYGKKLPSRLDTREAQCDPECCCPCACCPKPRKKKKC